MMYQHPAARLPDALYHLSTREELQKFGCQTEVAQSLARVVDGKSFELTNPFEIYYYYYYHYYSCCRYVNLLDYKR